MKTIDAHIHFCGDHPDCLRPLEEMDLLLLNVCVASAGRDRHSQREGFRTLAQEYPQRYAWCTSFDPPDFAGSNYAGAVIEQLERDFDSGAVACKFWKNIGMEIKKPGGTFLMIDDPLFDPIYDYLARYERTALMHIADPLASWQPPDEHNPHFNYYSRHSEWHMYLKPDYPTHEQLMHARDRVLERFPKLRVVGAHLASLEHDVAEVIKRLERFPNFAVDTSARILDLALQDKDNVLAFFLKYQDRILFGTDLVEMSPLSSASEEKRSEAVEALVSRIKLSLSFLGSEDELEFRGRKITGLGLPQQVVDKVTRLNAVKYYGIEGG